MPFITEWIAFFVAVKMSSSTSFELGFYFFEYKSFFGFQVPYVNFLFALWVYIIWNKFGLSGFGFKAEVIELSSINKVSLVYVSSCSNTGSVRDDPYWTSRKNSLELI
jgi:hypothetical protein